ncbi:hypothetical protein KPNJ1_04072 [Klebsiella pneumoniae 30660/NJST258_1]|uniref:Uncharacterized protein n=1 Tax=Klebsiella pneumoniae 30684/NJST258_2 TaxID=1420013 RepID=W8ULU2_KLEPN|nr:hypothetical protein KPNJ2_04094 [Klebsiella pneumoniae 30684/NJST258_2]AHM86478.1 hypothetical protein KPNJ1_04072 [Klebsiella pneumoniae 30660/NJST258_1]
MIAVTKFSAIHCYIKHLKNTPAMLYDSGVKT